MRQRVALLLGQGGQEDVLAYFTSPENAEKFMAWLGGREDAG